MMEAVKCISIVLIALVFVCAMVTFGDSNEKKYWEAKRAGCVSPTFVQANGDRYLYRCKDGWMIEQKELIGK